MPPPSASPPMLTAEWLAHRYDPGEDAFHLRRVTRQDHRAAAFLVDDLLPPGDALVVRRADALAAAVPPAPLHFVFHSAYCCSTLLARAFDRPGWAMGLKEPLLLNDLVGWRRRREPGPDMAAVLDDALTLMARPFADGEAVVAKPSTVANALAPAILTLRPDARALLLHAPLDAYVASIARKGLEGRHWVRTLLLGMVDDRLPTFGMGPRDHVALTDLQVAAIGWLGQQALFADVAARFGPDRVRTLDSATLMRAPAAAMDALARFYGLATDAETMERIVAGPAFTRHSKLGDAFDADTRAADHRDGATLHRDEIDKVVEWATAFARAAGVRLNAPAALLDGS